jgi:hypothetical protein
VAPSAIAKAKKKSSHPYLKFHFLGMMRYNKRKTDRHQAIHGCRQKKVRNGMILS